MGLWGGSQLAFYSLLPRTACVFVIVYWVFGLTQSDIYLNLNASNGITLNKATVFNDTVNTIGKFTSEGDFDVDIGATGTPEFRVLGSSVNFFERFSITHTGNNRSSSSNIFKKPRHRRTDNNRNRN